ncbi:T9SS type A sorting domain-containing protein [Labilibacter sediminis]|nr:T9SS type A sorting domain-containing protein [Labilibacter sediminis]
MKKIYWVLSMLTLVGIFGNKQVCAQYNVLENYNPSVEDWSASTIPDSWSLTLDANQGSPEAVVLQESTVVQDGLSAVKIDITDGGTKPWAIFIQNDAIIPVDNVKGKKLSFYAKGEGRMQMIILAFDAEGNSLTTNTNGPTRKLQSIDLNASGTEVNGYTKYEYGYHADPDPAVVNVGVRFNCGSNGANWDNSGKVMYLDNVYFDGAAELPTGIFSSKNAELVMYPNPASTGLVQIEGVKPEAKIEVYSTSGSVVHSLIAKQSVASFSVDNLPKGIYVVKTTANTGETRVSKLLVK